MGRHWTRFGRRALGPGKGEGKDGQGRLPCCRGRGLDEPLCGNGQPTCPIGDTHWAGHAHATVPRAAGPCRLAVVGLYTVYVLGSTGELGGM